MRRTIRRQSRSGRNRSGQQKLNTRDIIVIGASAGGVEAMRQLFAELPTSLPAAIFVVQHRSPDERSLLEETLKDGMSVVRGADRGPIKRGTIVLAPPDRHLVLEAKHYRSVFGPRENLSRPSVDVLFRSAALAFGPRVIGIVLTGALSDGTAGLDQIKQAGGLAIVQDPDEAHYPGMPGSALRSVAVDYRLPLAEIAPCLVKLTRERVGRRAPNREPPIVAERPLQQAPSAIICPECGGALTEFKRNRLIKFRCHVGHAFTINTLAEAQRVKLEAALWAAIRLLKERAVVERRLGRSTETSALLRKAEENERHAEMLRASLEGLVR